MFQPNPQSQRRPARTPERVDDDARFLKSWVARPLVTGAVTPSGRYLARAMASYVDPATPGPVIEIGPGTGPVTEALIRRGIAQERLILVEFNREFCRLLRERFPRATVVEGDAYAVADTLRELAPDRAAGFLSGLPLFTKPLPQRLKLLDDALTMMHPRSPFIQFTYAVVPPIPHGKGRYVMHASNRIWRNLPPARVWVYRRP